MLFFPPARPLGGAHLPARLNEARAVKFPKRFARDEKNFVRAGKYKPLDLKPDWCSTDGESEDAQAARARSGR